MNTKLIALIVVLLIGVGIAVYVWIGSSKEAGGDTTVMAKAQSFTCKKCGATFQKAVQAVIDERRTHDGHIYCPKCGAEDPEKQDVKVTIGGMGGAKGGEDAKTFDSDDKSNEEEEQPASDKPKLAPPGLKKKGG